VVKDFPNKAIFTWPEKPNKILYPTGCGDAFGAGVVWAVMHVGRLRSLEDYIKAFAIGSAWGAAACEKYGGCNGHIERDASFRKMWDQPEPDHPARVVDIDKSSGLLYMLD